jgi:hypothetical protein
MRDLVNHPFAIPGGKRSPVTKVWENLIEGGEIQSIRILKIDPEFTNRFRCGGFNNRVSD